MLQCNSGVSYLPGSSMVLRVARCRIGAGTARPAPGYPLNLVLRLRDYLIAAAYASADTKKPAP